MIKRRACFFIAVLLAGLLVFPARAAGASDTLRKNLPGSEAGVLLEDGVVYDVLKDTTITNSLTGGSGITLPDNACVSIYVAAGVTLRVRGGDGAGTVGGGAGILVPESSSLILTGEGTVIAEGGNAGNGGDGAKGEDGVTDKDGNYYYGGRGGAGGNGGGGAGAGIGTAGGTGASGGNQSCYSYLYRRLDDTYAFTVPEGIVASLCEIEAGDTCGTDGADGAKGNKAGIPGSIFILGNLTVTAISGEAGGNGAAGGPGNGATTEGFGWQHFYAAGGGGGGGAGHGGASADNGIGPGGSGGGAGGQGGSGGTYWSQDSFIELTGGAGGTYDDLKDSGTATKDPVMTDKVWGGFGGAGGRTEKNLFRFSLKIETGAEVEGAPGSAEYTLFDPGDPYLGLIHCPLVYCDQEGESFSGTKTGDFVTGFLYGKEAALPEKASRAGYIFGGWFSDAACLDGPIEVLGPDSGPGEHAVYAKWTAMNEEPGEEPESGTPGTLSGKMKFALYFTGGLVFLSSALFVVLQVRHVERKNSRRVMR